MLDIHEALRRIGVYIEDSGREQQIKCPFHKGGREVKPSARVYSTTNSIFCFVCHKSWSPVSLLAQYYGTSNSEMAARLHAGGEQVELPRYTAKLDKQLADLVLSLQVFPPTERIKMLLEWDAIFLSSAQGDSEEGITWRISEASFKLLHSVGV
jgi:hypothetical protein